MITYSYENFLANIMSFWVVAILPEIMQNNLNITNKELLSSYCGQFYSFFYFGIVMGAFMWPTIINYLSKRNSIFLSILMMGLTNYLMSKTINLNYIFFLRFLCGLFHNLNSVGKDFVYEFAKDKYRLYNFTAKTQFAFIASFIGPFFGFHLYQWCGKDFGLAVTYMTGFVLLGIVLFIVVFYVDFRECIEGEEEVNNMCIKC